MEGVILTMTYLFYVPKGAEYIRMLFGAALGGINDSLWDSKSTLLSMGSLLMIVGSETHMVDLDVGEMF